MELKTLLDAEVARLDKEAEFADKEYQRLRKAILAGKDVEDNLDDLKYVLKQRQDAYNACNAFDYDENPIVTAYELYERMSGVLTDEFGGTDDKEGRIVFPWHGRTLGFILNLLAKYFDIKNGMFTFDSSFTTHEAYTTDGYRFKMGVTEDGEHVFIDFGFKNLLPKKSKK